MQAVAQLPPRSYSHSPRMSEKTAVYSNQNLDQILQLAKQCKTPEGINGVFFLNHQSSAGTEETRLWTVVNNVYYYEGIGEFFWNDFHFSPEKSGEALLKEANSGKGQMVELHDLFAGKVDFLYVNESDLIVTSSFLAPHRFVHELSSSRKSEKGVKLSWKSSRVKGVEIEWTALDQERNVVSRGKEKDRGSLLIDCESSAVTAELIVNRFSVKTLYGNYGEEYLLVMRTQMAINLGN